MRRSFITYAYWAVMARGACPEILGVRMGAYRSGDAADAVVAPTRDGPLRLELAPHAIALRLDERVLQLVGRRLRIEAGERAPPRTLAGGL